MNDITFISRVFHWITAAALAFLAILALSACSKLQINVIGGCELPAALDVQDIVMDLPPVVPPQDVTTLWAKDRAHLAKAVAHGNATLDYVHKNCK